MCGIVGYVSIGKPAGTIEDKLEILKHRGPDGCQSWVSEKNGAFVGLGHRRLSIIDLSEAANQPFHSICGRYAIIFNGEIYNYKDLQRQYLTDVELKTSSDTEVLLNLYLRYGSEALNLIEGMFAFVLLDKEDNSIFVARDQLGIKPVYYVSDKDRFIFASEIKALFAFENVSKAIDEVCLTEFLLNGFLYEPSTGYKSVLKLESGHCMRVRIESGEVAVTKTRYWSPIKDRVSPTSLNSEDLNNKLDHSVKAHLVSDVPVGLFFSGGVDSSVLLHYLRNKVMPIVVKSDEKELAEAGVENDYFYACEIAKAWGVELKSTEISQHIKTNEEFLKSIRFLSQASEEMMLDYTFISSQMISRLSRELGYKVMLSGMGADEIFGGYSRYQVVRFERFFSWINKLLPDFLLSNRKFAKKLSRFRSYFVEKDFILKYTSLVGYFSPVEVTTLQRKAQVSEYVSKINNLMAQYPNDISSYKKAMLLDLHGFLAHNFTVADKSSMLESIEVRVPLATKALFEYVMTLKDSASITFTTTKVMLKKLLVSSLPSKWVFRRKAGFNPPLDSLVNNIGENGILRVFKQNGFFSYFNEDFVCEVVANHFKGLENNTYKIYQLLYLSYWIDRNK